MTTIAWDGRVLAADSLLTACGNRAKAKKVFRLKDGSLYGGCGDYQIVLAVKAWLNGGEKPKLDDNADFHCLLVKSDGVYSLANLLVEMPIMESFAAVGSGQDFALAALHLGKSAKEAVEVACRFDVSTGGEIDVLPYLERESLAV